MGTRQTTTEVTSPQQPTSAATGEREMATIVPPVGEEQLEGAVEALVLSSDRPLPASRLAQALGLEPTGASKVVQKAVDALNAQYEATGRSFRIELVAGGYRAISTPQYAPVLAAMHGLRESQSLSRAAVETLAIVAYRQPITRADIESIRGVASGEVLRSLLDKRLVDITGRAEELGRPMLYGTSRRFLELFGLASIKDLPAATDFAPASEAKPAGKSKSKATKKSGAAQDEPTGASEVTEDDASQSAADAK